MSISEFKITTRLAKDRTYMASIRTLAVFCGLSVLIYRFENRLLSSFILIATLIINLKIYYEYKNMLDVNNQKEYKWFSWLLTIAVVSLFISFNVKY
uniref:DUF202 domain-containing protein n=1 Tax=viral metagenome TaxID=1070528 RepID=A0A6C0ACN8_9ZZZZ